MKIDRFKAKILLKRSSKITIKTFKLNGLFMIFSYLFFAF